MLDCDKDNAELWFHHNRTETVIPTNTTHHTRKRISGSFKIVTNYKVKESYENIHWLHFTVEYGRFLFDIQEQPISKKALKMLTGDYFDVMQHVINPLHGEYIADMETSFRERDYYEYCIHA